MPDGDSELWRTVEYVRARSEKARQDAVANVSARAALIESLSARLTRAANEFYARLRTTDFYRAIEGGFKPRVSRFRQFSPDDIGWWFEHEFMIDRGEFFAQLYITINGRAYPTGPAMLGMPGWQNNNEISIPAACGKVVEGLVFQFDRFGATGIATRTVAPDIDRVISGLIQEMAKELAAVIAWRQ
jgi:hypothetical protein